MIKLIISLAILVHIAFAVVTHENEQLWKMHASTEDRREVEALVDRFHLDIWSVRADSLYVLINPEISSDVEQELLRLGLSYTVVIEDIQSIIDEQELGRNSRQKMQPQAAIDVSVYHTLEEINAYIDELVSDFEYISADSIGQSIEGRDIRQLRLATQDNNPIAIWIQCGIHANEWISPASCLFGLDYLTNNYGIDDEVTAFLDSQDVYMIVNVNPDGYSYTWTDDRNWRKNRRPYNGSECAGVDLNRNFGDGANFGGIGSSNLTCTPIYHGVSEFSEPETAAVRDKLYSIKETQTIKSFHDIHSFGNLWLYPYGHTRDVPEHKDDLNRTSSAAASAVFNLYGTVIEYGTSFFTVYPTSGDCLDWAYINGVNYSFTLELRDDGEFGFLLPEEQIVPAATECWTGIFAANSEM